jgi:hypothetical protein
MAVEYVNYGVPLNMNVGSPRLFHALILRKTKERVLLFLRRALFVVYVLTPAQKEP